VGVSLTYYTTEAVTAAVKKAIEADTKRHNKERAWWCENMIFFKHRDRPKCLCGDTKLFMNLDDDLLDDEDQLADALEYDEFMAFHDARFILLTLAGWSKQHGIDWLVFLAGEEVGRVTKGKITPKGLFDSNVTAKQLKADEAKAKAIHAKYQRKEA
jgi:hypothetical protein